jgi:hypothetical protein
MYFRTKAMEIFALGDANVKLMEQEQRPLITVLRKA